MAASHHMSEPIHRCQCRVLYGDTDAGGVVYYGNYMRYFETGRTEFLRALGTSYRELEERGFILPVVECYARYKASAQYDDLLIIESSLLEVKNVSCRFNHRIVRAEDNKLLVFGHTVNAVVDRQGRLSRFPEDFLSLLEGFLGKQE